MTQYGRWRAACGTPRGRLDPGMLFPLPGLSILAAFAIDRLAPAALKLKYDL